MMMIIIIIIIIIIVVVVFISYYICTNITNTVYFVKCLYISYIMYHISYIISYHIYHIISYHITYYAFYFHLFVLINNDTDLIPFPQSVEQ